MDPMKRDRKSLPNSGVSVIPTFLLHAFVLLPLSVCVLTPLAVISYGIGALFTPKKQKKHESATVAKPSDMVVTSPEKREFDIVIFGATGFTGQIAAAYVAKQYRDSGIKWAIAGRRADALEKLRTDIGASPVVILADSNNAHSLYEMANRARVVISTAGPYDKYGSQLVHCCAGSNGLPILV